MERSATPGTRRPHDRSPNGATLPGYSRSPLRGGRICELLRPFVGLATKLGALLTGLAEGPMRALEAEYVGRIGEHDTRALTLAALKGALGGIVHEPVSLVNAPIIARDASIPSIEPT